MIPEKDRRRLCYCRCCCLSEDPKDSDTDSFSRDGADRGYNRRTDCSCKVRWPITQDFTPGEVFMAARMRALDLGRPEQAAAIKSASEVIFDMIQDLA